jgi:hypothetical protein
VKGGIAVLLMVALAMPAAAVADGSGGPCDPTEAQYAPPIDMTECGDPPTSVATPSGTLPFTGLDVVSLLAVALAMTGIGLALRRLAVDGGKTPR